MIELAVLGLGSNIGNRLLYIEKAIENLYWLERFDILAVSNIYETEPWGFKNQNNFLNCAVAGLYRCDPYSLLKQVKEIETELGRVNRQKWFEREIDIDILFFGSLIFDEKDLIIPHPLIHLRNFVLKPLTEIMQDFVHPRFKKSIVNIYKTTKDRGRVTLYKKSGPNGRRTYKYNKSK